MKRFERPLLGHLTRPEIIAVLGQPRADWTSQRDHLLLSLLYNTGARVSEIIGVRVVDVVLDGAACVSVSSQFDVPLFTLDDGQLASQRKPWGFAPNPTLAGRQLGHGEPHAQAAPSVRKAPRYQGVGFAPVLARSVLARRCRAALRCGLRAGP
jgi:hypothetical protein